MFSFSISNDFIKSVWSQVLILGSGKFGLSPVPLAAKISDRAPEDKSDKSIN